MQSRSNSLFKNWLSILGPGVITAALVFGPSKITITSKMGADYGFDLIWVIVIAAFFMMVFTNMATRIGAQNDESLLRLIEKKFGKVTSAIIGIGIFLVTASFQAGNATGAALSISERTGSDSKIWIIVFTGVAILLLFFRSFYKALEKFMLTMIIIMLIAFLSTAIMIQPSFGDLAKGLAPSIPKGSTGLIIAFTASCFSVVGAFYQSYLVQSRRKTLGTSSLPDQEILGSKIGIVLLGVMSTSVLVCAAAVLHTQNIKISSASEMGKALEPLLGSKAALIFFIGLFGASFSSLIGNAVLGGSLLGDTFGFGNNLNNKVVKAFIILVMLIGAFVAITFGKAPLELIVFAQRITIFLVPFIGIIMFLIANDPVIMKDQVNKTTTKIWAALGLIVLITLAFSNLYNLFIK